MFSLGYLNTNPAEFNTYFLNNLFESILLKYQKNLVLSRKRGHVSVLQELKRWTVKVLNVQVAGEFVLLIAKKATQ